MATNARPQLATPLPDLSEYDTILVGSPIWATRLPMILHTFLEGVDLAGKRVLPFATYAVSGLGSAVNDYRGLAHGAELGEALALQGETVADSGPKIQAWLTAAQLLTARPD